MFGCNSAEIVTEQELLAISRASDATWYYQGSSDKYDFFQSETAGIQISYRVPYGEVQLLQRFPLSGDRSQWVTMPWGVQQVK